MNNLDNTKKTEFNVGDEPQNGLNNTLEKDFRVSFSTNTKGFMSFDIKASGNSIEEVKLKVTELLEFAKTQCEILNIGEKI